MRKTIYWANTILFHHIICSYYMTVCHPVIKKKKFRKPLEHMLRVYGMCLHCIVENFEMCGKFHYSPTLERRP